MPRQSRSSRSSIARSQDGTPSVSTPRRAAWLPSRSRRRRTACASRPASLRASSSSSSTKRDITHAMDSLPENFDPIGGHPICGKEKLGIENAEADLFKDTVFVITPLERTTMRAKSAAEQIVSTLGASCIEMTAEEHDKVFAATSHLPFLLSSALVHSTPQEFASFIGPGFRSTARLAGTPSHMMMGILKSNRDNVLNALRSFRSSLSEIESALQTGDFSGLETVLNRSRIAHQALIDN
ncbi:MAG: prephenate dehydrogenase [Chloroflexi bacterium]|nr:MAG: prephenate dehydrogenase [Chloroflexota bacterium]